MWKRDARPCQHDLYLAVAAMATTKGSLWKKAGVFFCEKEWLFMWSAFKLGVNCFLGGDVM